MVHTLFGLSQKRKTNLRCACFPHSELNNFFNEFAGHIVVPAKLKTTVSIQLTAKCLIGTSGTFWKLKCDIIFKLAKFNWSLNVWENLYKIMYHD